MESSPSWAWRVVQIPVFLESGIAASDKLGHRRVCGRVVDRHLYRKTRLGIDLVLSRQFCRWSTYQWAPDMLAYGYTIFSS